MANSLRFRIAVPLLGLALALIGCTKSKPSVADAESVLRNDVAQKSKGKIEVVTFEKTNGQDLKDSGRVGYAVEYRAKLRTKEPAYFSPERGGGALGSGTAYVVVDDPRALPFKNQPAPTEKLVPAGTEFEVDGRVIFELKEKGWSFAELNTKRLPNPVIDATLKPAPPRVF